FNMLSNSSLNYDHVFLLNISTANPAMDVYVDVSGGSAHYGLTPATMHGASASDPMYLVEDTLNTAPPGHTSATTIRAFAAATSLGSLTVNSIPVDAYQPPPAAAQKGSTSTIDTDGHEGSRIINAEWRNNRLVASQTIGIASDSQAHARWYEFDTST